MKAVGFDAWLRAAKPGDLCRLSPWAGLVLGKGTDSRWRTDRLAAASP